MGWDFFCVMQWVNLRVSVSEGIFSSPLKLLLRSVDVPHTWGWHETQHGGEPVLGTPLCLSVYLSVEWERRMGAGMVHFQ